MFRNFSKVCVLIGAYTLFSTSYDLSHAYYKYYQRVPRPLSSLYGPGPVLITGATSGLGLSYAHAFAAKGHDIILLARNNEKLKEIKENLEKTFPFTKIHLISLDLSSLDIAEYEKLVKELGEYDISILVNNAACFSKKNCGSFDVNEIKELIACNCLAPVIFTKIMKEKSRKLGVFKINEKNIEIHDIIEKIDVMEENIKPTTEIVENRENPEISLISPENTLNPLTPPPPIETFEKPAISHEISLISPETPSNPPIETSEKHEIPLISHIPHENAVINIGSASVDIEAFSTSDIYFSTKSYMNSFSRTQSLQISKPKTHIYTIFPGLLRTSMYQKFAGVYESFIDGLLLENTDYFTKQTVRCLGYEEEIYGSERQAFMHYAFKYLLNRWVNI